MASRPIFVPRFQNSAVVRVVEVEFTWFPGFSIEQKRRSIASLHEQAKKLPDVSRILEISTKSPDDIGKELSAFRLVVQLDELDNDASVESVFQGSKEFNHGGPFIDLYKKTGRSAKKDPRIKHSGELLQFRIGDDIWPLQPLTAFYDWLYLTALQQHSELAEKLFDYDAFTDIEFNPKHSINCQARSAALYVVLRKSDQFDAAMKSKDSFVELVSRIYA